MTAVTARDRGAEDMDRDGHPAGARRLLGIDLGERRIGVAVGDMLTGTAAPLATLSRGRNVGADARAIARLAAEHAVDGLVVGLPLDMSGEEGHQAAITREWAAAIGPAVGLPLRFRDERLTSERAEERIGAPPRGRSGGPPTAAQRGARRARIDREAAALILQDELDAMAAEATGPGGPGRAGLDRPAR
jgi:putative Holliday junction resolvase